MILLGSLLQALALEISSCDFRVFLSGFRNLGFGDHMRSSPASLFYAHFPFGRCIPVSCAYLPWTLRALVFCAMLCAEFSRLRLLAAGFTPVSKTRDLESENYTHLNDVSFAKKCIQNMGQVCIFVGLIIEIA